MPPVLKALLCSCRGFAQLTDFGLARVKAYTQTMTGSCGTYQWMAPEVLGNMRYTEKADGAPHAPPFLVHLSLARVQREMCLTSLPWGELRCGGMWTVPSTGCRCASVRAVFSFGMVCWELITRKCPFESMNQIQMAMGVLNHGLREVIPSTAHPRFAALVQRCWHHDPNARPSFIEVRPVLHTACHAMLMMLGGMVPLVGTGSS